MDGTRSEVEEAAKRLASGVNRKNNMNIEEDFREKYEDMKRELADMYVVRDALTERIKMHEMLTHLLEMMYNRDHNRDHNDQEGDHNEQ